MSILPLHLKGSFSVYKLYVDVSFPLLWHFKYFTAVAYLIIFFSLNKAFFFLTWHYLIFIFYFLRVLYDYLIFVIYSKLCISSVFFFFSIFPCITSVVFVLKSLEIPPRLLYFCFCFYFFLFPLNLFFFLIITLAYLLAQKCFKACWFW